MTKSRIIYTRPPLTRRPEAVNVQNAIGRPVPQPPTPIKQQLVPQPVKLKQPTVAHISPAPLSYDEQERIRKIRGKGRGRLLVILGNGPSLAEVDVAKLRSSCRIDLMTVNHPDPRVWPTPYWVFCDLSQYHRHKHHWDTYQGTIITTTSLKYDRPNAVKIRSKGGNGFSLDLLDCYYVGRSTIYANMQTAMWMDYDHVYILGCDMCSAPDGRVWSYGINPDVRPEQRVTRFENEAAFYDHASKTLPQGVRSRFTFCSSYNRWDFVDRFNRLPHESAVDVILEYA